ncbi:hypothetical protein Selin_1006 [Desulfurispirillum indicum S5]|uniref:Uncharacterized protein n=1 Tax=Desulfurispirillum indicum (strain ATCC BAA-1389 / DSM 22839 / S5) TaxID=653733 RepID=E6W3E8_DESIS|nr:hypothetical protein [Desulfurispirillum indicum]ADU65741.1 hypothetical protein Selin_1006 [Desulfurispirillum indicum S5]
MFSTSITQGVNPYSQVQKNAAVHTEQAQTNHEPTQTGGAVRTDAVTLSEEAKRLYYEEWVLREEPEDEEEETEDSLDLEWAKEDEDKTIVMETFRAYASEGMFAEMNPEEISVENNLMMTEGSIMESEDISPEVL